MSAGVCARVFAERVRAFSVRIASQKPPPPRTLSPFSLLDVLRVGHFCVVWPSARILELFIVSNTLVWLLPDVKVAVDVWIVVELVSI
jgi:hypothetical protein